MAGDRQACGLDEHDHGSERRLSRPGIMGVVVAVVASAALIFAATHVRVERSHRRTAVTFVGPAASWVTQLSLAGWGLSLLAPGLAARALREEGRGAIAFGVLTLYLSFVNILGSLFFIGVLED